MSSSSGETLWLHRSHETMRIKPTIRLIVTSQCNFQCSYPIENGQNKKWCHAEGIEGFDPFRKLGLYPDPDTDTLLRLGKSLKSLTGISKVRLAGLEPTLRGDIFDLISGFKKVGFDCVGITTNGSRLKKMAKDLVCAGLDELNVSIHSLKSSTHEKITGVQCLDEVLDGITLCKEMGLANIKINCVLLRREHMKSEIHDFLRYASDNRVSLRLYELFWLPRGNSWVEKYKISWLHYYPLWKPLIRKTSIESTTLPMRHRITFELYNGAVVQVDTFDKPKFSCIDCQHCAYQFSCEEGLFGCGLRVTPDLRISPCLYRDDLNIDLRPLCEHGWSEQDKAATVSELERRFRDWDIPLMTDKSVQQPTLV